MDGFEVDVIPYGPEVAPDGVVEIVEGVTLDVTGMAEAVETADLVQVGVTQVKIPARPAASKLAVVAKKLTTSVGRQRQLGKRPHLLSQVNYS